MPATASRQSSESTSRSWTPASSGSPPLFVTSFRSTGRTSPSTLPISLPSRTGSATSPSTGPERERFSDPDALLRTPLRRSALARAAASTGTSSTQPSAPRTDLPIAWTVRTARTHESSVVSDLLADDQGSRLRPGDGRARQGLRREACLRGLRTEQLPADHPAPQDTSRQARCPARPGVRARHLDVRRSGLPAQADEVALPDRRMLTQERLAEGVSGCTRSSRVRQARWRSLYRARAAVEREFGRLKHDYGLAPLRVRGLERVALHTDLVMLARLAATLARARAIPLAA